MKNTLLLSEVTRILNLSADEIKELVRSGAIVSRRYGTTYRFSTDSVFAYLLSRGTNLGIKFDCSMYSDYDCTALSELVCAYTECKFYKKKGE